MKTMTMDDEVCYTSLIFFAIVTRLIASKVLKLNKIHLTIENPIVSTLSAGDLSSL